jgi:hypothetical protein
MNITLPLLTLYFVPCIQNQEFQVAISPTMISGKDVGVQLLMLWNPGIGIDAVQQETSKGSAEVRVTRDLDYLAL